MSPLAFLLYIGLIDVHTCVYFPDTSLEYREQEAIAKCRVVNIGIWKLRVKLNPVVTLLSALLIWALIIWCMVQPSEANRLFSASTAWITQTWTWLYIGKLNGCIQYTTAVCGNVAKVVLDSLV